MVSNGRLHRIGGIGHGPDQVGALRRVPRRSSRGVRQSSMSRARAAMTAAIAASLPLFSGPAAALTSACSSSRTVRMPNATGTPVVELDSHEALRGSMGHVLVVVRVALDHRSEAHDAVVATCTRQLAGRSAGARTLRGLRSRSSSSASASLEELDRPLGETFRVIAAVEHRPRPRRSAGRAASEIGG